MKTFLLHMTYWLRYCGATYNQTTKKFDLNTRFFGIFGLSALQSFNFFTILMVIQLYTSFNASDLYLTLKPNTQKYHIISYVWICLMFSPFIILNYFVVCRGSTTKEMDAYFNALSKEKLNKSKMIFWAYVIFSILTFVVFINMKLDYDKTKEKKQECIHKQR